MPRAGEFGVAKSLGRGIRTGSMVLGVVNRVNTSNSACGTYRFTNRAVSGVDISSEVMLYGVTVRVNKGANLIRPSRGAVSCIRGHSGGPCRVFGASLSSPSLGVVSVSIDSLRPRVTYPRGMSGMGPVDRMSRRVSRMFLNSYAGNELDSLESTTGVLGKGGITGSAEVLIVPTSERVCVGTLSRKLVGVFIRTNTLMSTPYYKPYLKKRAKVVKPNRMDLSASGEGFGKERKDPSKGIFLSSTTITTTSTVRKGVMTPR